MNWVMRVWHRDRLDRDLDKELRFHVDEETQRLVAGGMRPDDARRTAMAAFGGIEPIKEAARDVRGSRWLEDLVQDARYAARTMRRAPVFATAAVLSLAIGIGANTAVFGVVDALLLRPLPVPDAGELSYAVRTGPSTDGQMLQARSRFSYPAAQRFAAELQAVHGRVGAMAAVTRMQVTAGADDQAELVLGQLVGGSWFGVLGVAAQRGRLLAEADDVDIGGAPVAVISDRYWTRRFGRDPSVVGSTIRLNGYPVTIVGVAAPRFEGFWIGEPVDVWVPTGLQQQVKYAANADIDGDAKSTQPWRPQDRIAWLTLVARVPSPTPRSVASSAMDVTFRRDLEPLAAKISDPQRRAFVLRTHAALADGSRGMSSLREDFGAAIIVLMATVALVLLIACANLANLLMARGASRAREFALRLSLGARRRRLVRQLLTESLALSLVGGVLSLLFAKAGSDALLRMASDGPAPLSLDVSTSWPIVLFAIAASMVTGVLFGLMPALRFSRADVHDAMKSGGRVVAASGGLSIGRLLVVAQVALSFVLLAGALMFVRTLHNLLAIDPGFDAARLVTAKLDPRMAGYTPKTMTSFRERLLAATREIPGAQASAVAMCGTMAGCHSISDIDVPGRQRGVGDDADVQEDYVSDGYFGALGMTVVSGRNFLPSDTPESPRVAIVNETMARHFFGDVNPIGRVFVEGDKYEIVGVVRDSRINGLRDTPPRMAFYPFSQHPDTLMRSVYVRTRSDVRQAAEGLRAAIREADRGLAVREVVTLAELEERSIARERLVSTLTSTFGLLAVAVACLGLYAMVSYSVSRRTNEIGIRLALGASPANVRWLIMRETLVLLAVGLCVGIAATMPTARLIASLLYGLTPRDPVAFASAVAVLSVVAMLAGAWPAWRASRVDPSLALRID